MNICMYVKVKENVSTEFASHTNYYVIIQYICIYIVCMQCGNEIQLNTISSKP